MALRRFPLVSLFGCIALLLHSCDREKKNKKNGDTLPEISGVRSLVLCEGNFQWGNADLDVYYEDSQKIFVGAYKKQNAGASLGDVLQSGVVADGLLWLVLNNSGKIVALDPKTFAFKQEIKGFKSPRFMLPVGNGEAWVTDLYANQMARVDLVAGKIISFIPCRGWSENLLSGNTEVAVASSLGRVYWYDRSTASLTDSTVLRTGSRWMQRDKNGTVWALASDSGKSVLYRINATNHAVEKQWSFSGSAMKLALSRNRDSVFYLADGLFAMSITDNALPASPVFNEAGFTYYGLGVNPYSGKVYLANARDYVSKGEIVVLGSNGVLSQRVACGINPGEFVFYQ